MTRRFAPPFVVASLLMVSTLAELNSAPAVAGETAASERRDGSSLVPGDGVIKRSGKYCLSQDLLVDRSPGIEVQADNVTLDFCGHAVRFTGTPREGVYGIVANSRSGLTISNGALGGFWFNVHCTDNRGLRIRDLRFDDNPYIAVNAAQSKDVMICDNEFSNFRYDLVKDKDSTYVIGINIGAEDAIISNNRFTAQPKAGTARDIGVETVFVLFSANVTQNCLVSHNEMAASEVLPRSYGVWVASGAQVTITNNSIHNMKFGVCLATDASAVVCFNRFVADAPIGAVAPMETFGISAAGAEDLADVKNTFEGISIPVTGPKGPDAQHVGAN